MYIPELIFGHLLTSSNYDDDEKKVTGGRNGFGAKLTNIFSSEFTIESASSTSGKVYKQTFQNNMELRQEPIITANKKGQDWTKISFKPDLAKFKMTALDDDIVALMYRRVVDLAGILKNIKIYFNNTKVPIRGFKQYVLQRLGGEQWTHEIMHQRSERWEVMVTVSENGFQHCSFVNGIATTKGGTHVNHVVDNIIKELLPVLKKKNKKIAVKNHQIKNHLFIFVNCLIENPAFDSQTKENLILKQKSFGSECILSKEFVKDLSKSVIVNNIVDWAQFKSNAQIAKACGGSKRTRVAIAKLEDANEAGTRNSEKCTLILTEGDSAKALAISGLSVVGRDYYGVFPLRGKLLNVREAQAKQITENTEIKHVCQILGLQFNKTYTDTKSLRYGRLMIMTDQDQDGSHIKGLLINFIHHFWPSLLQLPNFLVEFVTPIVKARNGTKEKSFFTLPQYEQWAEGMGAGIKRWTIKYYKGLGTSTPKEAKEYFAAMDSHMIPFKYVDQEDDTAIEMAFSKKKIEERKDWLRNFKPGTFLDHSVDAIRYADFVNQELVLFSMADNVRSIPSLVDGFKPGQRKVLFAVFKRKLSKEELKVAQLAGYVAEHSSYHHGEVSLAGTIVGMAQNFVGSNNISLLEPVGQFGTRLQGGKDAASARYIFTKMSALARTVFPINDDPLLSYLTDDGQSIEPEWYIPIIPMVLVNGSDGIGTGWSSTIPTYNPRDLIANIKGRLEASLAGHSYEFSPMQPWYKGFTGEVEAKGQGKYAIRGVITKLDDQTLDITELPIRMWTQTYKELLESMVLGSDKAPAAIKDYKEFHTDTTVHFRLTLTPEQMLDAEQTGLIKKFKLEASVATSNMMLFDVEGRMKKYDDVEGILTDFYHLRLSYYKKRKSNMADKLMEEFERLDNKVRFIKAVIEERLNIRNRKKADLLEELRTSGYKVFPKTVVKGKSTDASDDDSLPNESVTDAKGASDYDYLLGMAMWNLTNEKITKLKAELAEKESELADLLGKRPEDLWLHDLAELEVVLQMTDNIEQQDASETKKMARGAGKNSAKVLNKTKHKAIKSKPIVGSDDEDMDDSINDGSDSADDWEPSAPKKRAAPLKSKTILPATTITATAALVAAPAATTKAMKKAPASSKMMSGTKVTKSSATSVIVSDGEEEEPEEIMSLMDRLNKQAMTTAPAPTVKRKKLAISSDTEEDNELVERDEDEEEWEPTPARKKEPAPAKKPKLLPTTTAAVAMLETKSKTLVVASHGASKGGNKADVKVKSAAVKRKKKTVFSSASEDDEEEEEDDFFAATAKAAKPAAKKLKASADKENKPKATKAAQTKKTSEPALDKLAVAETGPAKTVAKKAVAPTKTKKAVTAGAPAAKKPTTKPKRRAVLHSDDNGSESEADSDFEPTVTSLEPADKPQRARRAVAARKAYTFDDSDEDVDMLEEDNGSDFVIDENDSDFML